MNGDRYTASEVKRGANGDLMDDAGVIDLIVKYDGTSEDSLPITLSVSS